MKSPRPKDGFYTALAGTLIIAICCFSLILITTAGAAGLSAFTPYFYYVVFPTLAVLIVVAALSYRRWRKTRSP